MRYILIAAIFYAGFRVFNYALVDIRFIANDILEWLKYDNETFRW